MKHRAVLGRVRRALQWTRFSRTLRRRLLFGAMGLLGLGAVWILVTGLAAHRQADQLREQLAKVKILVSEGRIADARAAAASVPAMAHRAHRLTTGPAWWAAANIPWLGAPLDTTREVLAAADRVGSEAIPSLMRVSAEVDPDRLRASGASIRLAPLVAARADIVHAASMIDASYRNVRSTNGSWLSAVSNGRNAFVTQLGVIRGYVDAAARAAQIVPVMFGQDAPKRYFIALQTESELRGTGGLPGAFAIATTSGGTLRFTRFESDAALLPAASRRLVPTGLNFGKDYDETYGSSNPTSSYLDSNVSPDFPYAAQIWAAMWEKTSGERIDGVLCLDATVLSYFLNIVGPTTVGGRVITGQNVLALTGRDQYVLYPDPDRRKDFIVDVLRAVASKLTGTKGSTIGLVRAATLATSQRRLMVWSRDPAVEALLQQTTYGGAIPRGDRPFGALILNNAASGKLDYYLTRTMTYSRTGCGPQRDVLITVTLRNDAPASGLPAYVTTRLDKAPANAKPGDTRVLFDYYATRGALLQSIKINGTVATAAGETASGHPVFRLDLELPRGQTQTIRLHLREPAGRGAVELWRQPGVVPIAVTAYSQSC